MKETVLETLAKFHSQGSNWRFHSALSLDLHTVKYEPLGASSYIPLPAFLAAEKAIVNLKNDDDDCFKWAIIRALNPAEKSSERIDRKLRETSKSLNWEGLKFPVNLSDINKFQSHNSSISVNLFGYENLVYLFRISKPNYKRESTVNLLLISDNTKQHYCWIKDISKLLCFQTSKHGHVRHVCFRCLNTLNSKESFLSHDEYCESYEAIKIELPKEGSKISFRNHNRSMRVSFIIYMLSLNPSRHSCQHANQTLRRATTSSIRNTPPEDFVTT